VEVVSGFVPVLVLDSYCGVPAKKFITISAVICNRGHRYSVKCKNALMSRAVM